MPNKGHHTKGNDMTATMTTADLATEFDTTPRELRKFLRSADLGVGKGKRYALPTAKREIASLRKKFDAWALEKAAPAVDEVEVEAIDEVEAE